MSIVKYKRGIDLESKGRESLSLDPYRLDDYVEKTSSIGPLRESSIKRKENINYRISNILSQRSFNRRGVKRYF